jgi:hypothetical protein
MIGLRAHHRAQLMASVQKHSEIWNALYNGIRVSSIYAPPEETMYAVVCDEAGARTLLCAAMNNCLDAVGVIEGAITELPRARH